MCKYILRKILTQKMPKNAEIFICEKCDFTCSKQSNYAKHLLTRKHKILTNTYTDTYIKNANTYKCDCGKEYKHRQSLNNHKKTCTYTPKLEPEPELKHEAEPQIVLGKQELINIVSQVVDEKNKNNKQQPTIVNNYITNTNNTTNNFNLNMFLNDQCKNAMNITDFIKSINVTIEDMDYLGRAGYVDAVSKVIVDGLNQLDITERPIHCTDAKRNSLYLKDNNEWNKETPDMPNMKKVIQDITLKNTKKMSDWIKENPSYKMVQSPNHKQYLTVTTEAFGPYEAEDADKKYKSIINKVSSATRIDKQSQLSTIND